MSKAVLPTLLVLAITSVQAQADTPNSNRFYAGLGASLLNLKTGITEPEKDDLDSSLSYTYKTRLNLKNGVFQLGYQFSENFSVEGQYSSSMQSKPALEIGTDYDATTSIKGDLAYYYPGLTNTQIADVKSVKINVKATSEVSVATTALYAVYKTSGNFYAKFKGGPVSINVTQKPQAKATWTNDLATTTSPVIKEYLVGSEKSFHEYLQGSFKESAGGEESERDIKFALGVGGGYKFDQHFAVELEFVKMGPDVSTLSVSANYYF